jgi:hypothetical protein
MHEPFPAGDPVVDFALRLRDLVFAIFHYIEALAAELAEWWRPKTVTVHIEREDGSPVSDRPTTGAAFGHGDTMRAREPVHPTT